MIPSNEYGSPALLVKSSTMDALADYGSDDDSSISPSHPNDGEATGDQAKVQSSLSGLLGAYSDTSSSDSESDSANNEATPAQTAPAINKEKGRVDSDSPVTKKQRKNSNSTSQKEELSVLPPQLGSSSIILWGQDFVSRSQPMTSVGEGLSISSQLGDKLKKLSATTSTTSWADHLKAQREFHNPHFFRSVVEHFGIQNALGSHICKIATKDYDLDALGLSQKSTDIE